MKKQGIFLVFSLLVACILIFSGCSNGTQTGTKTTAPAVTTTTKAPASTTATSSTKPQYGGKLTIALPSDVTTFDPVTTGQLIGPIGWLTNEQWIQPDWTQGLAGSGKTDWLNAGSAMDDFAGYLAESVTYPEPGVMVFQVRQGVHYSLDSRREASKMIGGREMTAQDWVDNMNMFLHHDMAFIKAGYPTTVPLIHVTKTGPWEVTFEMKGAISDELRMWHWLAHGGGYHFVFPPELWTKYGNLREWKNNVGTGAFMIDDFVPGTQLTLIKNQNFWHKNPIGPGKGDQLPYVDELKMLILPDLSTRLSALRTGKIDAMSEVTADDAKSLMLTSKDLLNKKYIGGVVMAIAMRQDKQDLPYKDIKVRQALMMATDFKGIADVLYGGDAEILVYPISRSFKRAYMPMADLPADVQELYSYNPEKAKQLLTEAGYPNGFKAQIIVSSDQAQVDALTVYKNMWEKINVNLDIVVKEPGVYSMLYWGHQNQDMLFAMEWNLFPVYLYFGSMWGAQSANQSFVNDPPGSEPTIQKYYEQVTALSFTDPAGADKVIHDMMPYVLRNAWYIERPQPFTYSFWWPWLKNYNGEYSAGFWQYAWIDQSLKQSLSGK
jgi:peptide/nickel transport system substrate-binding protein